MRLASPTSRAGRRREQNPERRPKTISLDSSGPENLDNALHAAQRASRRSANGRCRRDAGSSAESALARLIGADRTQEIDFAEGRPEHVGKVEFAVRALPQQKSGQTDLAAGAD